MCLAASFVAASFLSESFVSDKFCSNKFVHLCLPGFLLITYMNDSLMRMPSLVMFKLVVLLQINLLAMVYTIAKVLERELFNNMRFPCLGKIFPIMVMANMAVLSTNILAVFVVLPVAWAENMIMSVQVELQSDVMTLFSMIEVKAKLYIKKLQNTTLSCWWSVQAELSGILCLCSA